MACGRLKLELLDDFFVFTKSVQSGADFFDRSSLFLESKLLEFPAFEEPGLSVDFCSRSWSKLWLELHGQSGFL